MLFAGFGLVLGESVLLSYAQVSLLARPEWNLPAGAVAVAV